MHYNSIYFLEIFNVAATKLYVYFFANNTIWIFAWLSIAHTAYGLMYLIK